MTRKRRTLRQLYNVWIPVLCLMYGHRTHMLKTWYTENVIWPYRRWRNPHPAVESTAKYMTGSKKPSARI